MDSINSDGIPFTGRYRTSKSILKKSNSGNNYYSNTGDSDTEKLITDSASTTSVCDNEISICDALANVNGTRAKKRPTSPLLSRQVLESIFRTNNNTDRTYTSDETSDDKKSVIRTSKILFDDIDQGLYVWEKIFHNWKRHFKDTREKTNKSDRCHLIILSVLTITCN